MLEITKIESQKNKNKYNLFVNGEFYAGVLKESALANNFFVGKKIDKDSLDKVILDSYAKQAFNKALDYVSMRQHSKQELKLKLMKKSFGNNAIELAICKLEDYGYVDDYSFAKEFVTNNSKLSKQMLKNKLKAKGVSVNIINQVISDITEDKDLDIAIGQVEKYLKNKNFEDCKQKLFASLMRKGFSSDTIKKAINAVIKNDTDWE